MVPSFHDLTQVLPLRAKACPTEDTEELRKIMTRPRKGKAKLVLAIIAVAGLLGVATPAAASAGATLDVVVIGAGSVSSRPAGINCPGKCVASFPAGTKVALLPKANKGSTFLRWGGSCAGKAACDVDATTLASVAAQFSAGKAPAPAPHPAPSGRGFLASGVPVTAHVKSAAGVTYKFVAVADQHVTLAISNPHVSGQLNIGAFDSSGAQVAGWTGFSTGPIEVDFTPTASQAGVTAVEITQNSGDGATGTFTLTYAKDVTGQLASGISKNIDIAYGGQDADYTFTAVAGHHLTLSISNPHVSGQLNIGAFDSSGAQVAGWTGFSTGPIEVDFTPTASQAGLTTVVVAQNSGDAATGTFALTYATDVTGRLKAGERVPITIKVPGQDADYTLNAVVGRAVSLAISNPNVSAQLNVGAFDASGAQVAGWTGFSAGPINVTYTPAAGQGGLTTVVVAQNSGDAATGSFTLTYTAG